MTRTKTVAPPDTPIDAQCASCTHSPAYHDGDGGRCCRAWDPDQPEGFCVCKGWKDKPKPTPWPNQPPPRTDLA